MFISLVVVFAQITRYIAEGKNQKSSPCESGIQLMSRIAVAFASIAVLFKGVASALGARRQIFLRATLLMHGYAASDIEGDK